MLISASNLSLCFFASPGNGDCTERLLLKNEDIISLEKSESNQSYCDKSDKRVDFSLIRIEMGQLGSGINLAPGSF